MESQQQTLLHVFPALPFAFESIARPDDLAGLVNAFYVARTAEGHLADTMPAYSAQFLVFVEGKGALLPEDGASYPLERVCFTTPQLKACDFALDGPVTIIGASLTPLGWQALAKAPADKLNGKAVAASQVLLRAEELEIMHLARRFSEINPGPEPILAAIARALRNRRGAIKPQHAQFVRAANAWLSSQLNPSVFDLYDRLAMSQRTVQRLCRRYFGVSPTHLVKRYRAIRAAMLLANPQLSQEMRDEIQSAYFDQAHLIHDIRRYTGRTPSQLREDNLPIGTLSPEAHGDGARIIR